MNLDIDKWGDFRIADLFPTLQTGKANQGMLTEGNDCFYVGAKKEDNGVMIHCAYDSDLVQKGNCIIFICNGQGSVGYANYMDVDFIGTTDIVAGYNEELNQYNGLFIATILCQERPKYSFGRKWKTHLRNTVIKLPQTAEGTPDWRFMEQYIKALNHKPLTTSMRGCGTHTLDVEAWKDFCLGDYFDIKKGRRLTSDDQTEGNIPYIGAIDSNNGIANYIGQDAIHDGNTISLSYNGSVGEAFYQPEPFWATDDVNVLYFREENGVPFNKYIALFVCAVLRQEKYRYSYGRKWVLDSMKSTIIKLPEKSGKPDWHYMENYMKVLPYGDRI
jgi:hypothetical protein